MSYKYIKNKIEFEKLYPYDKKHIKSYPKSYPCVMKITHELGGIAGSYHEASIIENLSDFIYENGFLYKKCN